MDKIVILTNRREREHTLVRLLRDLFPECEVSVVTIPEGTGDGWPGEVAGREAGRYLLRCLTRVDTEGEDAAADSRTR